MSSFTVSVTGRLCHLARPFYCVRYPWWRIQSHRTRLPTARRQPEFEKIDLLVVTTTITGLIYAPTT